MRKGTNEGKGVKGKDNKGTAREGTTSEGTTRKYVKKKKIHSEFGYIIRGRISKARSKAISGAIRIIVNKVH
jgi:hypothetical protein